MEGYGLKFQIIILFSVRAAKLVLYFSPKSKFPEIWRCWIFWRDLVGEAIFHNLLRLVFWEELLSVANLGEIREGKGKVRTGEEEE